MVKLEDAEGKGRGIREDWGECGWNLEEGLTPEEMGEWREVPNQELEMTSGLYMKSH